MSHAVPPDRYCKTAFQSLTTFPFSSTNQSLLSKLNPTSPSLRIPKYVWYAFCVRCHQLDDKFMNSGSGAPAPQTSNDKGDASKKDADKKDSGKGQEKKG
ncbi:unnamed protein product [Alternaria alternata]